MVGLFSLKMSMEFSGENDRLSIISAKTIGYSHAHTHTLNLPHTICAHLI